MSKKYPKFICLLFVISLITGLCTGSSLAQTSSTTIATTTPARISTTTNTIATTTRTQTSTTTATTTLIQILTTTDTIATTSATTTHIQVNFENTANVIDSLIDRVVSPPTIPNLDAGMISSTKDVEIKGVRAGMIVTKQGQSGFRIIADDVLNISDNDLKRGNISWVFLPESIDINDTLLMRKYALDNHYGFSNNFNDVLIDDGSTIPDQPSRIAIFGWNCSTEDCDTIGEMGDIIFMSEKSENILLMDGEQYITSI